MRTKPEDSQQKEHKNISLLQPVYRDIGPGEDVGTPITRSETHSFPQLTVTAVVIKDQVTGMPPL